MGKPDEGMKFSHYLLGLAGGGAVAVLLLGLAWLIILGNRSAWFVELQRYLERLVGG